MTFKALDKNGVEYRKVDLTEDSEAMDYVRSLGYMQAPVVVVDPETHWSGFRPDAIKAVATSAVAA